MIFNRIDDKRIEPRYAYPKTIEYATGSNNEDGFHKGVVINISRSGICLYVYASHSEGQMITIKSNLPVESRTAMVKWIKKVGDGFYKSGLQFIRH